MIRPPDGLPAENHDDLTRGSGGDDVPAAFGPYRLLSRIGEGGMGEVWLADQMRPVRRRVAVKVIKAGMDSAQVIARFEAERQALAMMDHPAIAKVFDGGTTPEGRPYFVMEYVPGESHRRLLRPASARSARRASSCSSSCVKASSTRTRRASSTAT